jgi:FMN phosphatase YigB (HAD superfamily)
VADVRTMLITDLDNTLYDFVSFYEAAMNAQIRYLSDAATIEFDELVGEYRAVFERCGSIEYPFAAAWFGSVRARTAIDRRGMLEALRVYWAAGQAALSPYPTVATSLRHIHRCGVPIVAMTDAPIFEAARRLRSLGLHEYFSGLIGQAGRKVSGRAFVRLTDSDVPGYGRLTRAFNWSLTANESKPNPAPLERLVEMYGVCPTDVFVVGDSLQRDLAPAVSLGMNGLWARYGTRRFADEQLLPRLVPSRLPEVSSSAPNVDALPIDSFSEVVGYLPIQQCLAGLLA